MGQVLRDKMGKVVIVKNDGEVVECCLYNRSIGGGLLDWGIRGEEMDIWFPTERWRAKWIKEW